MQWVDFIENVYKPTHFNQTMIEVHDFQTLFYAEEYLSLGLFGRAMKGVITVRP